MNTPDSLIDRIRCGVEQGHIPVHWTSGDLICVRDKIFAEWSEATLRSVPWSHSETPSGDHRGDKIALSGVSPYVRVERTGRAWRYCLREHYASEAEAPPSVKTNRFKPALGAKVVIKRTKDVLPPSPTTRDAFATDYQQVIDDLLDFVTRTTLLGRQGWIQQLHAYQWGGKETTWLDGVTSRRDNATALRNYLHGQASHHDVFKQIVYTWGGIRQLLTDEWEPQIRTTMNKLEASPEQLDVTLCGGRIASVSKLYAAKSLDTWVIYDSRVAAAITYLIAATGHQAAWGNHWGVLAAKNPKRLRMLPGFPRIYPGKDRFTNRLAFQSFVFASWLCQILAERLNAAGEKLPGDAPGPWKAFHIEMVLFMLGRDLNDLPAIKQYVVNG